MATVTAADLLIQVDTLQYPLTLEDMRQANPLTIFGSELDESDVEAMGYALVHNSDVPEGDVVTEGKPAQVDGAWTRQWDVRAFNEDELEDRFEITRAAFFTALAKAQSSALAVGMPYQINHTTYHVQLREQDKSNLLGLVYKANKLVSNNAASTELSFRPYENVTLAITAADMVTLCDSALAAYEGVYTQVWALKDQADGAVIGDTMPTIPADFFATEPT